MLTALERVMYGRLCVNVQRLCPTHSPGSTTMEDCAPVGTCGDMLVSLSSPSTNGNRDAHEEPATAWSTASVEKRAAPFASGEVFHVGS